MSSYNEWSQEEDSEEEENVLDTWDSYKCASVFVIDNSKSMFNQEDEDGHCLFKVGLLSCISSLENFLFKSYHHTFALNFLNTKQEPIVSFSTNLVEALKQLYTLTEKSNKELRDLYCCDNLSNDIFYECFINCVELFKKNDRYMKKTKRHIALITNNAQPDKCTNDDEELERAMEKLQNFGIQLIILPMMEDFQWECFYKNLINKSIKDDMEHIEDFMQGSYSTVESLVTVLKSLMLSRKHIKRVLFRLYSKRNHDSGFFYVQVAKFVKDRKIVQPGLVNTANLRPCIKAKRDVGGQELKTLSDPVSIPGGNKKVQPMRYKNFRYALTQRNVTGFKLLYVSEKRSTLHYLKKRLFMVQNDNLFKSELEKEPDLYRGRQALFDYFWEYCKSNNKVLICKYTMNPQQKLQLCELRPDQYKGQLCFIGQFLANQQGTKKLYPHLNKGPLPSQQGQDLTTAIELIQKMTVNNPNKPYQIIDPQYLRKSDAVKGTLFSSKHTPWQPPDIPQFWPTQQAISLRIGQDLIHKFNREYLTIVPSRKRGRK